MTEKKFHLSINEGEAFFAHEVSVNFGPSQFVLDFKSITPRMDMRSRDAPVLAVKHNVILLEPHGVKDLARILSNLVKKYEKEFSKIEKPAALKKYEKQKKRKTSGGEGSEAMTYFG